MTESGPSSPPAPTTRAAPSRSQRIIVALGCALVAFAFITWRHYAQPSAFDADHLWYAARALLDGKDPYEVIGPGREFEWSWPLLYPMTAVVLAVPFAPLSDTAASIVFTTGSIGVLAYMLTRDGYARLPLLVSACTMDAVRAAQNTPLLTAAMLSPWLFFLAAAKPNIGVVMCAATTSRRALYTALGGGVVLLALAFISNPDWVLGWREALKVTWHMRTPVLSFGGPLLLLALLRWRREEARYLVGFACIPHSMAIYDLLPLGLTARTFRESLAFAVFSLVALVLYAKYTGTDPSRAAMILNVTMYLPCLVAVLLRPNEGAVPAWWTEVTTWRQRWSARNAETDRAH